MARFEAQVDGEVCYIDTEIESRVRALEEAMLDIQSRLGISQSAAMAESLAESLSFAARLSEAKALAAAEQEAAEDAQAGLEQAESALRGIAAIEAAQEEAQAGESGA